MIQLRFRANDKDIFEAIRSGAKKVETRAASERFIDIKAGDLLSLVCGKDKLEKKVGKVQKFKTIAALLKRYRVGDINPAVKTGKELEKMYYNFPGYKEKIKKFGLMAIELK